MKITRFVTNLTLALAMTMLTSASGSAQAANVRSGFALTVGAAAGSAQLSCDGCTSTAQTGPAGLVRISHGVGESVVVGAEASGWSKSSSIVSGTATTTMVFVSAVVQWYPAITGGFIKGGVGISHVSSNAEPAVFGTETATRTGGAIVIGAGWDFQVAGNVAISPYADLNFGPQGSSDRSFAAGTQQLGGRLMQAGLTLTLH